MNASAVGERITEIAAQFAQNRAERQARRELVPDDFAQLGAAGFLLTGVPVSMGGLWADMATSTRPVCEMLRTLARADASVALVASMHPAVLSFWLCQQDPPPEYRAAWEDQSRFVAQTALDGAWWGTITSEPGSGGDVGKTKAEAKKGPDGRHLISGQKHFGSGSGISSYMITTAVPEGEDTADWFFMELRGVPWDGTAGIKLISEWDGHGMIATQSHAFEFSGVPGTRMAWPGNLRVVSVAAGAFVSALFTAVIVGVVDNAVETAREQVIRRKDSLRPFERVEWARIELEAWLVHQAYDGMLNSIEARGAAAVGDALHAKTAIAELAESLTGRICRVVGGGTFHRASPLGAAFEDVRALGFLRPPWGLAYDSILDRAFES
jgi:alkylation response protein AidB-like acyl-CoA dehydrogenase